MVNYDSRGDVVEFTAPGGGVVSGLGYKIGSLVVIATVSADASARFNGMAEGIIEVVKVSAQAWTEGVKIYWDDSAKKFTTTSGGNTLVGVASAVAANPSSTGKVRLDGVAR